MNEPEVQAIIRTKCGNCGERIPAMVTKLVHELHVLNTDCPHCSYPLLIRVKIGVELVYE